MPKNDQDELIGFLNATDANKLPVRRNHRLPQSSYASNEGVYFFTLCARHQGTPFTDPVLAKEIIDSLLWRSHHEGWILYCYCLMPDHLHFLVKLLQAPGNTIDAGGRGMVSKGILEHITYFKRYTTNQSWRKRGGTGSLWQRSSYDHILGWDSDPVSVVDYIVNNPVRKGLVDHWKDHPYSAIVDTPQSLSFVCVDGEMLPSCTLTSGRFGRRPLHASPSGELMKPSNIPHQSEIRNRHQKEV